MSLLDGPHTVTVYPEETVTDHRGNVEKRPSKNGVKVRGRMQPLSSARGAFAARSVEEGQDVLVAYKFFTRTAPVGWFSRLDWFDPDTGTVRKFVVLGGPQNRKYSPSSGHISVTLSEER